MAESASPSSPPSPLYASIAGAVQATAAQSQLTAWAALAALSLGVAGIFAFLLALSRTPGIERVFPWPVDFFHKALVIHVVFSFVVWFLAVFGALLLLATYRLSRGAPAWRRLGPASALAAGLASPLLFAPALMDRGAASLNNYVPVIIDPIYYAGLLLLLGALAVVALRVLFNLPRRRGPLDPFSFSLVGAAVIYLVALLCLALAYRQLLGQEPSHGFNEDLFWGAGHVLQFLNATLLLAAWYVLGHLSLGRDIAKPGTYKLAVGLLVVGVLPAPFYYAVLDPFSALQREAFTDLQYLMAPSTLVVAALGLRTVLGRDREGPPLPWKDPTFLCLVLSPLVFGVGGMLGLFVDGTDTRTPAHYHGVIAGINVAFMGLFYGLFLPLLGRAVRWGKFLYTQIFMFAGGQLLASVGLFLAGGFGAPRKTAGAAQGLEDLGAVVGLYMNGVGAAIAVIGGIMFIWTVASALLRKPQANG